MTRGSLTTFSIANDVAKYFAIIPAMFAGTFPVLNALNIMRLQTPQSAVLSAGNLQRSNHHCPDSAGVARCEIPRHGCSSASPPQSLDLWGGRNHYPVRGYQADRYVDHPGWARLKEVVMKRNLIISVLMTIATTVLLGIIYPLIVTGMSLVLFPKKANGQLLESNGKIVGSRIIGQTFSSPGYFHSRPSAAGNGYDATASNGSQWGPTNQKLVDRVKGDVAAAQAENPGAPIPIDLVTASGSGLDPEISPAAAAFQVPRVAKARGISEPQLQQLLAGHTENRQWGFLGEPRVNVLELNLDLDKQFPGTKQAKN